MIADAVIVEEETKRRDLPCRHNRILSLLHKFPRIVCKNRQQLTGQELFKHILDKPVGQQETATEGQILAPLVRRGISEGNSALTV
jgi:hypothetical protein